MNIDTQLLGIKEQLHQLADLADSAIKASKEALFGLDRDIARRIIQDDDNVDGLRFDIEAQVVALIATHQPVARDVREVVSILYVIVELERMGDYAEGIARVVTQMPSDFHFDTHEELVQIFGSMFEKSLGMVEKSMEAFFARDEQRAREVCVDDDAVDALYREALGIIFAMRNEDAQFQSYLTWVAHNLERIADRSTNIAERTVYLVTGKMEEIGSSKY